jgi:large subunit ribosomal protein L25
MEKIILEAVHRNVIGKKVKALRREGKLPAALFGHGVEATPILLDMREAKKVLASTGQSTLLTITLDGNDHTVLVRERQRDVLTREYLHVDFQALSMTETVRAFVNIEIGEEEAPAVKTYNAIINTVLDVLEIECLPENLIDRFVVDISGLMEIGDHILVKDLPLPEGIQILDDPTALIVVASAPMAEEAEDEELEAEGAEPEVIEKAKDEEDED